MSLLDIVNIKTQIKSILDTANTITASADLSSGLTTRVQKVLTYNLEKIPPQASFYPLVTCFISTKSIENTSVFKDQAVAKRKAEIDITVAGAAFDHILTDITKDESQDQIEAMMENVELILRSNHTLNSAVNWSYPTDVTYHSFANDEETYFRVGLMNLKAVIRY